MIGFMRELASFGALVSFLATIAVWSEAIARSM
jgi:hypothetical protein